MKRTFTSLRPGFKFACLFVLAGIFWQTTLAQSPGGVAGARVWLKADAGTQNITYLNVPAANRTASSINSATLNAAASVLTGANSWSALTAVVNEFLTLDLGSSQTVNGIVTRGRGSANQFVTTFTISYSADNVTYTPYGVTFRGNTDQNTEVINLFTTPITSRYIRIIETAFSGHPSMRVDLVTTAANTTSSTTINVWSDNSGNANHATSGTISSQSPTYFNHSASSNGNINFNPVIKFDGSNDAMTDPNGLIGTGTFSTANTFIVSRCDVIQNACLFFEGLGTGTQLNFHAPYGGGEFYWDGAFSSRINGTSGAVAGLPNMWTGFNGNTTETNKRQFRRDGLQLLANTTAVVSYVGNTSPMIYGAGTSAGTTNPFNGAIGEVIYYTNVLDATQRQKIESYLAIKYGRTLDQTTATNYLASDASVIWNATTNSAYKNNIAGIGRDDASGLLQKQSTSTNTTTEVVIGVGSIAATNAANTNTSLVDKAFLTWGDNGLTGALSAVVTNGAPAGFASYRLNKIWKVQETTAGLAIGSVQIAIAAANLPMGGFLVTSGDATFATGNTFVALTPITINGTAYFAADADLANGSFFTFASQMVFPGGVASPSMWVKADAGFNYSATVGGYGWADASGSGNYAVVNSGEPGTGAGAPGGIVNFNPAVDFDGNDIYRFNASVSGDYSMFGLGQIYGSRQRVFSARNVNHLFGFHGGNEDRLYVNGNPNLASGGQTAPLIPRLFNFTRQSSGAYNMYRDGFSVLSGASSDATAWQPSLGGYGVDNTEPSQVYIPEFIAYDVALSTSQKQRVESYLAIKYGVQLYDFVSASQSSPANYYASDWNGSTGTVVWSTSTNAGYNNAVTVIGRDDVSGLNQKQSKNTGATGLITLALGGTVQTTNAANSNTFGADKVFDAVGDNGGSFAQWGPFGAPAGRRIISRAWKVQETGTVGSLTLQVPDNTSSLTAKLPAKLTNVYLLVDADGDFTSGATETTMSLNGTNWEASVDFVNGRYFTFATESITTAPGGVTSAAPTSGNYINGVYYELYSGYDGTPEDGVSATLKQWGYVSDFQYVDDNFLNEIGDNFSTITKAKINIATAGNYQFQSNSTDDEAAIFIDGVLVAFGQGTTFSSSAITLTAGLHDVEFRFSEGSGAENGRLMFNGPDAGGATFVDIPAAKFFVPAANMTVSAWYKADAGISPNTEAATVTSWNDQSPNANHLVNGAGSRLYYGTTASELLNYNPVFKSADGSIQSADDATGLAYKYQGRTVFTAARSNSASDVGQLFGYGADNNNYGQSAYFYNNGTTDFRWGGFNADLTLNYSTTPFWTFPQAYNIGSSYSRMASATYSIAATNNATLYYDGAAITTATRTWGAYPNDNFDIAACGIPDQTGAGNTFTGCMGEVVIFPWTLTTAERNRVESYLSTKYGLMLNQASATNYTASDGTTAYWNAATNTTYKNNITIIGRDDATLLNQKQSKSAVAGGLVAVALGNSVATTNAGNANTFGADKTFEAIADDAGTLNWTGASPPAGYLRLARTWRVQETGTVGNVTLQVADDNSGSIAQLPTEKTTVYLLKSNSASFGSVTPVAMTLNGTNWEITTNFVDGDFFTFATESGIPTPGGVTANNVLWLRSDRGIASNGTVVRGWADQSPRVWNSIQTTTASQPAYNTSTNLINFNPTVGLNQTFSQYLVSTNNLASPITSNAVDAYMVGNLSNATTTYSAGLSIAGAGTLDYNLQTSAVLFIRANGVNNFVTYRNGAQYGNATGLTAGATYLSECGFNGANQYIQSTNGRNQATTAYTNAAFNSNRYTVGCRMSAGGGTVSEFITGNVAEVILYDAANSNATDRQKIRSYLAIKYGQTLDQTTPYNYIAADGTVLWDATTNSTYKNNITVIGRDDASALNQKQSKSQNNVLANTAGLVTVGLTTVETTNALNTSTFAADKYFEAFGDNGGSIAGWTGTNPPSGRRSLPRVWKVQETGTIGTVRIQVPDDGSTALVKLPTEVASVYLLVGNSGTDFTGATEYPMTLNGTNWEADVDFNNNDFFTFGTFPQAAPGNVLANNVLWLKADAGVTASGTVSAWNDLSPKAWQASQATAANQPTYNTTTNLLNFNPTVGFDGSNDYFLNTTNLSTAITSNAVDGYMVGNITGGSSAAAGVLSLANNATVDATVSSNAILFLRNNGTNNILSYRNATGYLGSTSGMTPGASYIHEAGFNGSNQFVQAVNARNLATTAFTNTALNVNKYSLGCRMSGASGAVQEYMAGNIAEVILYDVANSTASDRQKIRSYLAIKYGQTLDQTTPNNYVAADGTVLWDATANSGYKNNITVIGRDDLSLLQQKQSKSQNNGVTNSGGIITISKGSAISTTNANNNGTFTADKSFIAFGDNGANTYYTAFGGTTNTNVRMNRTWKVQRTGTDNGTVTLQVSDPSATYLLVYSDASLSTLVSEVALTSSTASGVALSNGQYFTFGKFQNAPGGVVSTTGNINGLNYRLYDAFTASPALGIPGNLIQSGYINTVTNPENFLASERGDAFTIWLTGKLQIVTGGNYTFSFVGTDDVAALFIDGVQTLTANTTTTTTSGSVSLTAGLHDIDVRYSENTGGQVFALQYSGPDGTGAIPDSRLFTSGASISAWYRADMGTAPFTDATPITTWADQSANANNLTNNGGGTRTLSTTTASGLLNFNPSVFFTNAEMQSVDNPNGLPIGRSGRALFMVSTKTAGGSDHAMYHGNDQSNAGRFNFNSSAVTGGDNLILSNVTSPVTTPAFFWTIGGGAKLAEAVYESPGVLATNNTLLYADGFAATTATRDAATWSGTVVNDNGDFSIGTYVDGGTTSSGWDGMIPEVIYYPWQLSATERVRVESYLAIKYGISLGTTASPVTYLASDGSTIPWTGDATYQNNVTVIGRDDISVLNQKQSKSQGVNSLVTVALGGAIATSNALNTNSFASNKQFLAFGDNGALASYTTYAGSAVNTRYLRVWKVKETGGDVGNVTLKVGDATATHLLVSTTPTFNAGTVTETALSGSQTITVNLADGAYFTFGRFVTAPAGVASGLSFWLKADAGTSVNGSNNFVSGTSAWADQSPYGRHMDFVSSDPQLVQAGVNFNPTVAFDGDDYMRMDAVANTTFFASFTAGDMLSVIKSNSNNSNRAFPYYFGSYSTIGHHYTYGDGTIYTGFGTNLRKAWNPSTLTVVEGGVSASTQSPAVDVLKYHIMDQHSGTNDWKTYFDGRQQYQATTSTVDFSSTGNNAHLGAYPGLGNWWGEAAEYILYNRVLTTTEKQLLNTYLAIRYGITLDQTVATNYLASDATTVLWNATSNSTYKNNIAVIGRDDLGQINQKQAKSINTTGLVTVALGTTVQTTNAGNTNTFSADKTFLAIGDNGGAVTWTGTNPPFGKQTLPRTFKLQETGTVGTVRVQIPDDASTATTKLPAENTSVYLYVDADGDFSAGATVIPMTLSGTNWEANVDFDNSNAFFTIGTDEPNPVAGIVTTNQTCGGAGATLTVAGHTGKIQWQSSADGINWTNVGSLTTVATLAVTPSATTFYRAVSNSNSLTANSNIIIVTAAGTNTGDMTITADATLAGTINLSGDFKVNSGVTVTVLQGCPLVVNATNITVNGVINADGAGYTGGTGGTAGTGINEGGDNSFGAHGGGGGKGNAGNGPGAGPAGSNGAAGTGGQPYRCGTLCTGTYQQGYYAGGGGGGGGAGGAYGAGGGGGANGAAGVTVNNATGGSLGAGSATAAANGLPGDVGIDMGSGGSGAGGGGGGWNGGTIGGNGGTGGGSVSLIASNALTLTGTITANGTDGGNGGNGGGRSTDLSYNCSIDQNNKCGGGLCSRYGSYGAPGGGGAGAGGGSGGGIKLQGFGLVTVTGSLSVNGGKGGNAGLPYTTSGACFGAAIGGGGGSGGRIKIIANPCQNNVITPAAAAVAPGTGGTSGNAGTGSTASSGTYVNNIVHPSYTPLVANGIVSANQGLCVGGTPTAVDANASTGGTGSYVYQWYVTKTNCAGPTTGTGAAANNGWAGITANGSSEDLSVAGIQQGMADVGGGTGSFCFQRRTQSGTCYAWTGAVTVSINTVPTFTVGTTNPTTCSGTDGLITLSGLLNSTQYTLNYMRGGVPQTQTTPTTNGSGQLSITGLNAATYSNIIVDLAGCPSAAGSATLSDPARPAVSSASVVNPSTCGGTDGSIILNGLQANATYSVRYTRNGNSVSPFNVTTNASGVLTIPNLPTGSYTLLTVTINNCQSSIITVPAIVNPPAPSPPTVGSNSPACEGGNINLTAAGQSGATYDWTDGLSFTSTDQNPVITNATTGMSGNYCVTQMVNNCVSSPACVAVTVTTTCAYTWTGLGPDNNWTTATNWNIGVPINVCASNVTIPAGTPRNPVLTGNVSVGDISVGDAKNIDLGANTLTTCGNWTGGTTTASTVTGTGAVILTGASAQTLSGRTAFTTLHVSKATGTTATMQSNALMDISTALELESGTLATGSGTLTFKSTSITQVAVLDNFSSGYTGTITGSIVAERYYASASAGSYSQHYMGSPVSNANLAQFGAGTASGFVTPKPTCDETALASTSVYGSVFSYDQSNGAACALAGWKVEPGANAATPAKGFSVAKSGAGVLSITGLPNLNSTYSQTGANSNWSNSSLQSRPMTSGWTLVSNPFLATLDLTGIPTQNGFTAQIKVWHTTGAFAGSYQDATVIAPFQAFFVQKQTSGGNTYTIDASRRTRSTQAFQQQNNDHQLSITAVNNSTGLADVTSVAFNTDATDQFDADYDGQKIAGTLGRHTLYTVGPNLWMSKNVLHDIATTSTVTMGLEPGVSGSYSFTFDGLNSFDPTSYITLEDRKLNTFYDVRNGDYQFTADTADPWERFVLHFTPAAEIATVNQSCDTLGQINVEQPGTATWNYTITASAGDTLATGTLNQATPVGVAAAAGTYLLTLTDNNNYTVAKTITVNGTTPITAAFTPSVTTIEEANDVTFTSTTTNAATTEWDFGDGAIDNSNNANPTHSYTAPGTYVVTLTVTNAEGCSSTMTQTITVTEKIETGIADVGGKPGINIWSHGNRVFIDFSQLNKVDATIEIYNILGQKLVNEKFARSTVYNKTFTNLEAAYVIVKVRTDDTITAKKVFIANTK